MKVAKYKFIKQALVDLVSVCLVLGLCFGSFAWAKSGGKLLYRYKNASGVIVLDSKIPKEYVSKGYSIIDAYGSVIEEIPPALSEEEKQKLAAEEKAALELDRKKKLRAKADEKLLKTFADPEDAERARDRQIETLDIQINITRGNIKRLEESLVLENQKAANMERSGSKVSEEILQSIARIENQIKKANSFILGKEQEKVDLKKVFEVDIQRLRQLKQQVVER